MTKLTPPVNEQDHIQGNENAPVTLVEYGDFECPYCGEAYPIVKVIQDQMKDQLRFVYRYFPLTQIHVHAFAAAKAAEAAGMQGKFWEMHDMLFDHQHALEDEDLLAYADTLGLDTNKFTRDFGSETVTKEVNDDFISGIRSGVNGTPTFFINGLRYDGSYEYDELLGVIEREVNQNRLAAK